MHFLLVAITLVLVIVQVVLAAPVVSNTKSSLFVKRDCPPGTSPSIPQQCKTPTGSINMACYTSYASQITCDPIPGAPPQGGGGGGAPPPPPPAPAPAPIPFTLPAPPPLTLPPPPPLPIPAPPTLPPVPALGLPDLSPLTASLAIPELPPLPVLGGGDNDEE